MPGVPMAEFYLKSNGWPVDRYLTGQQAAAEFAEAAAAPRAHLVGDLEGRAGFLYVVDHVPGVGDIVAHLRPVERELIPAPELEWLERAPAVPDAVAVLVDALAKLRRRERATHAAVAGAVGVTPAAVAGWEKHRDMPSVGSLVAWVTALGRMLVVVNDASGRWLAVRAVPRAGESPERLWIRGTALTLRDARREAEMTQREVAEQLHVSTWAVGMWENSRRTPYLPELVQWCAVLGCHLELRRR